MRSTNNHNNGAGVIHREDRTRGPNHNPATPCPNSRPNRDRQCARDTTHKGMGMTGQQDRIAREREEIAARVANFKATQEKFERAREEYFVTTLDNARHSFERPSFWT
jgi:hypothetical protein